MNLDHTPTLSDGATMVRCPTRRRLLELLAALPSLSATSGATKTVRPDEGREPLPKLFETFQRLLVKREAALRRCDQLVASLRAGRELPRVRLPMPAGLPVCYAADDATIVRHVPPGTRRFRLQQVLHDRQDAWAEGARACGLIVAQGQEAALDRAVRDVAAKVFATPTHTAVGIRIKLAMLLAVQAPGAGFRDAAPWRELHFILEDLGRLAADG